MSEIVFKNDDGQYVPVSADNPLPTSGSGGGGGGPVDWEDVENKPEYLAEDGLEFESLSVRGALAGNWESVGMGGPALSQSIGVERSDTAGYSARILGHYFTSVEAGPEYYELTGNNVALVVDGLRANIGLSTVGGQTLESILSDIEGRLSDIESRLEALEAQLNPEP